MANEILTDEELEFLLSAHAAGVLQRPGSVAHGRYCALDALLDLYSVDPSTDDIENCYKRYRIRHPQYSSGVVSNPFDRQYRSDMTDGEFLAIWEQPCPPKS